MHASTSTALYQLVVYLTRPLTKVYPVQTVAQLQLFLHTNLASQFLTSDPPTLSPFTLLLSPASLPPTPLYAACLQSGVAWPQWIRALGGQPMSICVLQDNIKVRVGHVGDANANAITIWSGSDEPTHIPAISKMSMKTQNQLKAGGDYSSPMTRKLQAILDSVRSRNAAGAVADKQQPKSIALPALLLPTTNHASSHADADTDTDSDDISDSESDTESTSSSSSSSFSETSSTESMTSLSSSSTSSSPVSKPSDLPALPADTVTTKKGPVYIPRHRLTTRPTTSSSSASPSSAITTQHLSRSQRPIANATVDTTKVDLCRYTYQGGQTCVMTGGVMLGAVKPKLQSSALTRGSGTTTTNTNNTTTNTTKQTQPAVLTKKEKKSPVMLGGPDSSRNWRVRV